MFNTTPVVSSSDLGVAGVIPGVNQHAPYHAMGGLRDAVALVVLAVGATYLNEITITQFPLTQKPSPGSINRFP